MSKIEETHEASPVELLSRIRALAYEGSGPLEADPRLSALMVLRRAARQAFRASHEARQSVAAARAVAEEKQLVLEGLLFERAHLLSGVEQCKQFEAVQTQKIRLIPERDFWAKADEKTKLEIESHPRGSREREHQLMLARLSQELQLRKGLRNQLKQLEEEKEKAKRDTADRLSFLESLPTRMKAIVEATEPIQEHFGENIIERLGRHAKCKFLPEPLYMVYCQLEAYGDTFGGVSVSVEGEEEERNQEDKKFREENEKKESDEMEVDEEAELGKSKKNFSKRTGNREAQSKETKSTRKRKRGEMAEVEEDEEEGDVEVETPPLKVSKQSTDTPPALPTFEEHPFSVRAHLQSPNKQVDVLLVFKYFPALNVVTVEAENQRGLLANIYPNDTGQYLPHTSMEKGSVESKKQLFPEEMPGRPYKWLQWLAGIYNLTPEGPTLIAQPSTGSIVKAILDRVGAQESLSEQLHALEKCPHPVPVHESATHLFPSSATTKLVKWTEISASEADEKITSSQLARLSGAPVFHRKGSSNGDGSAASSWATFGRRCFHGVLMTQTKETYEAIVQVFVDYPVRAPHFTLLPTSDSMVAIIQSEVNDHADELRAANELQLLSHQLRRLQMCLDVLAKATSSSGSSKNKKTESASQERMHRGRDRRLAFVFDPETKRLIHR